MSQVYEQWQRAYERRYHGVGSDQVPCPGCGRYDLRLVFVGSGEGRLAAGYFWCTHELVGIVISRTYAPEGETLLDPKLPPEELDDIIPDFGLIRPEVED